MNRNRAAVLLALSQIHLLVNALSLANFQQITSAFIPLACQLTYDSQIPICTIADFEEECSSSCVAALKLVAQDVSDACDQVNVSPLTLLGVVLDGGIVEAVCATPSQAVTISEASTQSKTTSTKQSTSTPQATAQTTTTSLQTTTSAAQTSATKTSAAQASAAAETTELSAPTSTLDSAASTSTTSTKKSKSTTSKATSSPAAATQESNSHSGKGEGTGGGSPFDITSSGSHQWEQSIFVAVLVASWAGILLGR